MSHVIYTLFNLYVDLDPGKKAKLFEYAEGPPPDVAVRIYGRQKLHLLKMKC